MKTLRRLDSVLRGSAMAWFGEILAVLLMRLVFVTTRTGVDLDKGLKTGKCVT